MVSNEFNLNKKREENKILKNKIEKLEKEIEELKAKLNKYRNEEEIFKNKLRGYCEKSNDKLLFDVPPKKIFEDGINYYYGLDEDLKNCYNQLEMLRHSKDEINNDWYDGTEIISYENIQRTYPHMDKIITDSLKSRDVTQIDVLGLCLYHMWEYLKNFIKKSTTDNMDIFLSCIDSSSPNITELNNNWHKLSDNFTEDIQKYLQTNQDNLKKMNIKIEIKKYTHIPIIHGILIDNKHLFLSYTQWNYKDTMEGAENFYVYYNSKDTVGKYHIEMFKTWINHIKCR